VTHGKAWIEIVHRYLATGVGVLILVLAVATWWARRHATMKHAALHESARDRPLSAWWPAATLVWVCLQGAFGALTVTWRLYPAIVTLHLMGAMVLLALLCAQAVRYRQAAQEASAHPVTRGLRAGLWGVALLLFLQVALGGWVSTNYAVLACTQFPQCQNSWWPPMNFNQGFTIWRELGETQKGVPLDFSALTAIHYVHRLSAYVVFAALFWLAWRMWAVPALRQTARALVALALWQFFSGLTNVVLDWPLLAAVAHTGGAAALVVVMTSAIFRTSAVPETIGASRFPLPRST
jgi:cytochrome c oxidase assembly protein subunit 15